MDGKDEIVQCSNFYSWRGLERNYIKNLSYKFCIVCCMVMNKDIFMSSLAFRLSISLLLLSSILSMHRLIKRSSLRLGSGDFDVLSPQFLSMTLVTEALPDFRPSRFVALACTCETTWVLSDMNLSTSWYQRYFQTDQIRTAYWWPCLPCICCR